MMNQLLIKGGELIDGKSNESRRNGSILIKDGMIQEVSEKVLSTNPDVVINASGNTVLPGLYGI